MDNQLATRETTNSVSDLRSFGMKLWDGTKAVIRHPLTEIALLLFGGYIISNNIMEHDYDATADFGITKFSLSSKKEHDT